MNGYSRGTWTLTDGPPTQDYPMNAMKFQFPDGISEKEYWALQPTGVASEYVVYQISKACEGHPITEQPVIVGVVDGAQTYFIRRKYVTVERISKYTGIPVADIGIKEIITLSDKPAVGLPKATVDYWGEG